MSASIGAVLDARITGVASFGVFARIPESGADGLVPISTLPSDYYDHDPVRHRLIGRRWGRVFALGDTVRVLLVEADPIGGRLVFRVVEDGTASAQPATPRPRRVPYRRRR
jgi:ribonuclease R